MSVDADLSPKLQVVLQALHINHRPACWASLSGLTTGISKGTHSSRVADATNQLNSVEAQRLAQAQRAVKGFMLPTITLQVAHGICNAASQSRFCLIQLCTLMFIKQLDCLCVLYPDLICKAGANAQSLVAACSASNCTASYIACWCQNMHSI